jgi:AcrR family transcriptional regulator
MSPKIVNKAEKKTEIARVALGILAGHGFANTSIARVAKAANIGKGTVYEYFRSKDELVLAAMEVWVLELSAQGLASSASIQDPRARLRVYTHAVMAAYINDKRMIRLSFAFFQMLQTNKQFLENHDVAGLIFEEARRVSEEILVEAHSEGLLIFATPDRARRETINLLAYVDGLASHYVLKNAGFDLHRQVDLYLDNLYTALGGSPETRNP